MSNHRTISYVQEYLYHLQLQSGGPYVGVNQIMNPKAFKSHISWLGDRTIFSEGVATAGHQEEGDEDESEHQEESEGAKEDDKEEKEEGQEDMDDD